MEKVIRSTPPTGITRSRIADRYESVGRVREWEVEGRCGWVLGFS